MDFHFRLTATDFYLRIVSYMSVIFLSLNCSFWRIMLVLSDKSWTFRTFRGKKWFLWNFTVPVKSWFFSGNHYIQGLKCIFVQFCICGFCCFYHKILKLKRRYFKNFAKKTYKLGALQKCQFRPLPNVLLNHSNNCVFDNFPTSLVFNIFWTRFQHKNAGNWKNEHVAFSVICSFSRSWSGLISFYHLLKEQTLQYIAPEMFRFFLEEILAQKQE